MTPIALARRCALLLLATALAGVPALAAGTPPRLFGPTLEGRVALKQGDASAVRARAVRPDLAAIDALARGHLASAAGQRFVLDLFPGLELEAEVIGAEVRASGTTLFARLDGLELGTAILTHEAGVLVGTIDFPGGNYAVERLDGDGANRVVQKAAHLAPPELPPRVRFAPARADGFDAEPDVPVDSGRLIDVMIVWTPAAQTAGGGATAMQSLAQASIDNANLMALLVLVAVFAGQLAWHYRDLIAAHVPSTRPLLARMCALGGCEIRPLRDVAWLSIDASDLQADPAHKGLLILTATVRNRAPYAVAYPHLELTLTDAQDGVVVRRALAPAEYLGAAHDAIAGIAGHAAVAVRLFVDASATTQSGYRVYLFYP